MPSIGSSRRRGTGSAGALERYPHLGVAELRQGMPLMSLRDGTAVYGVKDVIAARGTPTSWGVPSLRNPVIDADATAVARLADAGAVLVTKLVTTSLAGAGRVGVPVPCGIDVDGFPASLHLIGPPGSDRTLLAIAAEYQRATDIPARYRRHRAAARHATIPNSDQRTELPCPTRVRP